MRLCARIVAAAILLLLTNPPALAAVIDGDTVWQGTVRVSEQTTVPPGVTLLVLPGTRVLFEKTGGGQEAEPRAELVVKGTLVAQGRADAEILFTSASTPPQVGDWGGLLFDNTAKQSPSRLSHCRVEYAAQGVRAGMATLVMEHCRVSNCEVGFSGFRQLGGGMFDCEVASNRTGFYFNQSTGFGVENSRIRNNEREGFALNYGSSVKIRNCEITGNGKAGVVCLQGSSPMVEGCLVEGQERGIFLELKSRPVLVGNDIVGNGTGIWAEKLVFPQIVRNRVAGNGVGIYCNYSAYPQIHENDLAGNETFALVLGDNQSILVEKKIPYRAKGQFYQEAPDSEFLPPKTRKFTAFSGSDKGVVDARGNWWGSAATEQMQALGGEGNVGVIEDRYDKPDTEYRGEKFARDVVVFTDWEDAPVPDAGRPEIAYSGVAGKILYGGEPLAGGRVHVYRDSGAGFRGAGFTFSSPAGADGRYALNLAPGRYFLVAKRTKTLFPGAEPGPGEYFSYYGGNPVLVTEGGTVEVNLRAVQRRPFSLEEGGADVDVGMLEGTVTGPGGPVAGAAVYLYPNGDSDFRGPDLFGPAGAVFGGAAEDGSFQVELPPGTYHLVATHRRDGFSLGPLRPGDLYGFYDGNPVEIGGGQVFRGTIQVVEKLKETGRAPAGGVGLLGIRGTIRDPDGEVPPGVFAFASRNPMMMGGMPPFRSEKVDAEGGFFIPLPAAGTYYVGARSGYGGPPLPGEWYGVNGGEVPRPVVVEQGVPTPGVDFSVKKME